MKKTCENTLTGSERIDVGIFSNSIPFNYFDLSIRDINQLIIDSQTKSDSRSELLEYLQMYPLICGLHTDIDFTPETYIVFNKSYIIPELMMEYFINKSLSGIGYQKLIVLKYSSVKDGANPHSSNFAFFAHQKNSLNDYCTELSNLFMRKRHTIYHEDIVGYGWSKIDAGKINDIRTNLQAAIT
jgi:hypothetical protein